MMVYPPGAIPPTPVSDRPVSSVRARALIADVRDAWGRCWLRVGVIGLLLVGAIGIVTLSLSALLFWAPQAGNWVRLAAVALLVAAHVGAVTRAVYDAINDRPVSFSGPLSAGLRGAVSILAAGLVPAAGFAGMALLLRAGMIAMWGPGAAAGATWFAWALGCLVGLFLAGALVAVVPGIIIERLGPLAALRMSWSLTRGHRKAAGGANLSLFVSWIVGAMAVTGVLSALLGPLGAVAGPLLLATVPFPWMLPAVAYDTLRVEKGATPTDALQKVFE